MVQELTYKEVRRTCEKKDIECDSTSQLTPLGTIVGQDRAVKAMQFGLRIASQGFNIFVSGIPGTGRKTAIHDFVRVQASKMPVPPDWCWRRCLRRRSTRCPLT